VNALPASSLLAPLGHGVARRVQLGRAERVDHACHPVRHIWLDTARDTLCVSARF